MMDRKKILIIDDEEDFLFFVKGNLENTGEFHVLEATSGKEGIEIAMEEKPDLIFLDISMPEMSGEEVAKRLSKIPETKETPVIFLTALITKNEIEDGGISSIAGHKFIPKPIATKQLVAAINSTLG
ncbi:MAG: response regulator [Deltaproteobacteria bacterium]|nr:response regulator [Deltaproteobacteria bacterium]